MIIFLWYQPHFWVAQPVELFVVISTLAHLRESSSVFAAAISRQHCAPCIEQCVVGALATRRVQGCASPRTSLPTQTYFHLITFLIEDKLNDTWQRENNLKPYTGPHACIFALNQGVLCLKVQLLETALQENARSESWPTRQVGSLPLTADVQWVDMRGEAPPSRSKFIRGNPWIGLVCGCALYPPFRDTKGPLTFCAVSKQNAFHCFCLSLSQHPVRFRSVSRSAWSSRGLPRRWRSRSGARGPLRPNETAKKQTRDWAMAEMLLRRKGKFIVGKMVAFVVKFNTTKELFPAGSVFSWWSASSWHELSQFSEWPVDQSSLSQQRQDMIWSCPQWRSWHALPCFSLKKTCVTTLTI